MIVGPISSGAQGFDCNNPLTKEVARRFRDDGMRFALRYVPRVRASKNDLSAREVLDVLSMGLGLMPVQHVDREGWHPTEALGIAYGTVAAREAARVGIPKGVTVWLDLEGVALGASVAEVVGYCNAWYDAVFAAGYEPGIYVGWRCVLSAWQLYQLLKFKLYWGSYNINLDVTPVVRGWCMRQGSYPAGDKRIPRIPFAYDTDVIHADALGGTPTLLLPEF